MNFNISLEGKVKPQYLKELKFREEDVTVIFFPSYNKTCRISVDEWTVKTIPKGFLTTATEEKCKDAVRAQNSRDRITFLGDKLTLSGNMLVLNSESRSLW